MSDNENDAAYTVAATANVNQDDAISNEQATELKQNNDIDSSTNATTLSGTDQQQQQQQPQHDSTNNMQSSKNNSEPADDDFCRFCRSEATPDKPLYHPCVCAGSIKYIHQECLVHWLKYSEKDYCELCHHKFKFMNIYAPDMPKRLPLTVVLLSLVSSFLRAAKDYLHQTFVIFAWAIVTPVITTHLCNMFLGMSRSPTPTSLYAIVREMLSPAELLLDIVQGCFIVTCSLILFIGLCWLRDQILRNGLPNWPNTGTMTAREHRATATLYREHLARMAHYERLTGQTYPHAAPVLISHSNNSNTTSDRTRAAQTSDRSIPNSAFTSARASFSSPGDTSAPPESTQGLRYRGPTEASTASTHASSSHVIEPSISQPSQSTISDQNILDSSQVNSRSDESREPPDVTEESGSNRTNEQDSGHGPLREPNTDHDDDDDDESDFEDEFMWDRVFGFDGSMLFLQHVPYIIGISGSSIITFAFIPYHFGASILYNLSLDHHVPQLAPFKGVIMCSVGYLSMASLMALTSRCIRQFAPSYLIQRLSDCLWWLDFAYIVLKVSLMLAFEAIVCPLTFGCFLDLATLSLVGSSFADRRAGLIESPYLSLFVHWIIGWFIVLNVLYFINVLNDIVKPSILSLLYYFRFCSPSGTAASQNANHHEQNVPLLFGHDHAGANGNASPNVLHEVIHETVTRFAASVVCLTCLITAVIGLMIYAPVEFLRHWAPDFLPYSLSLWPSVQTPDVPASPSVSSPISDHNSSSAAPTYSQHMMNVPGWLMSPVSKAPSALVPMYAESSAVHIVNDAGHQSERDFVTSTEIYQFNAELLMMQMFLPFAILTIDGVLLRGSLRYALSTWCHAVCRLLGLQYLLIEPSANSGSSTAATATDTSTAGVDSSPTSSSSEAAAPVIPAEAANDIPTDSGLGSITPTSMPPSNLVSDTNDNGQSTDSNQSRLPQDTSPVMNDEEQMWADPHLIVKLAALLVLAAATCFVTGLTVLTLPAAIGRSLLQLASHHLLYVDEQVIIVTMSNGSSIDSVRKGLEMKWQMAGSVTPIEQESGDVVNWIVRNMTKSASQPSIDSAETAAGLTLAELTATGKHHEYNTIALGFYLILLVARLINKLYNWRHRRIRGYTIDARAWIRSQATQVRRFLKASVVSLLLLGFTPLMAGFVFHVTMLASNSHSNNHDESGTRPTIRVTQITSNQHDQYIPTHHHVSSITDQLMPRLYMSNDTTEIIEILDSRLMDLRSQALMKRIQNDPQNAPPNRHRQTSLRGSSTGETGSRVFDVYVDLVQDWIIGMILLKMGAAWLVLTSDRRGRMREALEQLYERGPANVELQVTVARLAVPIIATLAIFLIVPYALVHLLLPPFGYTDSRLLAEITRNTYRYVMYASLGLLLISAQARRLMAWYERVKDERYLVGRRLVNYNPPSAAAAAAASQNVHSPSSLSSSTPPLSATPETLRAEAAPATETQQQLSQQSQRPIEPSH